MRSKHPSHTDVLFTRPLGLIREHCVPFAVQQSYQQMESSVYYVAESCRLPPGTESWVRKYFSAGVLI